MIALQVLAIFTLPKNTECVLKYKVPETNMENIGKNSVLH